ncbi:AdhC Zn-dependent alcohol dehydrogenases, class III [Candidatus Pelagibacterales bacterium]
MYFKSAILAKIKSNLLIKKIKLTNKLGRGQVLIKLMKSSICGAQINEICGIKGHDKYLPHMLGHEGYGKVIEIGQDVRKVKKGETVIMHWRKSYGLEGESPYFESNIGRINCGKVTTFSEYSIVSENRVTKATIPNKIKKVAPLLGCALSTSYGIVYKEAKIKKNDKVLIIGCGGLGLSIAGFVNTVKCDNLYLCDNNFNIYKKKFINNLRIKELFKNLSLIINSKKNYKFSKIIETTGNIKNIEMAFNLLENNSELILVGQPKKGLGIYLNNALSFFNKKKIYTSDGGSVHPGMDLKKIIKIVNKYHNLFNNLISHTITLNNINKGIKMIKNFKTLRVMIKFE